MAAWGWRRSIRERPGQVVAWPGVTADGEPSVWVVVPHRKREGLRNTARPRVSWGFTVEQISGEATIGAGSLLTLGDDLIDVRRERGGALWASDRARPDWVGRRVEMVDREDVDLLFDARSPPSVLAVGVISGLIREVSVPHAGPEPGPWATVLEVGVDDALVFGDELQVEAQALAFASPRLAEAQRLDGEALVGAVMLRREGPRGPTCEAQMDLAL